MSPRRPAVPRLALLALILVVVVGAAGAVATGADPDRGSVSADDTTVQWTGKDGMVGGANRTTCTLPESGESALCDEFELDIDLGPEFWARNNGTVDVGIAWEDDTDNFNMAVYDKDGTLVGTGAEATGDREVVKIAEPDRTKGPYTVSVYINNAGAEGTYSGGAEIMPIAAVADGGGGDIPTEPVSGAPCTDGKAAGIFPCKEVDLEGFLPLTSLTLEGDEPAQLNDIWGWTDPETGKEYAIVGKTNGTSFVDVSDPRAPRYLGDLPTRNLATPVFNIWRDMKVYKDHAFIVSEEPLHGMQVFDLKRLRGVTTPQRFDEDAEYDGFGSAHNIALNEETGFAYVIGSRTCAGGSQIVNVQNPTSPVLAGCVAQDGYTHDTQCVVYDGPDDRFAGREICFDSNEDSVTIVDVTNKLVPRQLAKIDYGGVQYTHQGWLTDDKTQFLVNDELDEQTNGDNTTTRIFNVEKLDDPTLTGAYEHPTASIDHNNYVKGNRAFQSNYRSGLRVLDTAKAGEGTLETVGFFDVYPADDDAEFNGSWSNYPYFGSGNVIATGIEQGLFVVRPSDAISEGRATTKDPTPPSSASTAQPAAARSAGAPSTGSAAPECAAPIGFRSTRASRSGRGGLTLGFTRSLGARSRVSIDVFQQSVGRRVIGERLVARFAGRSAGLRWNGKANRRGRTVTDGYYFVRYRTRTADGTDTRRVALRRVNGRWSSRPGFDRRLSCDLLRSFKLERPVFGGRANRALGIAYRVSRDARVTVSVLRGSRVVKRFAATSARAGQTRRLRFDAEGRPRGDFKVRIAVRRSGERSATSTATTRRL